MTMLLISVAAFVGVAALVGSAALMFRGGQDNKIEDRLSTLAGIGQPGKGKSRAIPSLLSEMQKVPNIFDLALKRLGSMSQVFEQADTTLTPKKFFIVSGGLAACGAVGSAAAGLSPLLVP